MKLHSIILLLSVFKAVFKVESSEINSESSSPNYKCGEDKCYSIEVKGGQKIRAEFTTFELNGEYPSCEEDWVEIFLGCNFTLSTGRRLCTSEKPFPFYTEGNCLGVKYHVKNADSKSKFVLEYDDEDADKAITTGTPCNNRMINISPQVGLIRSSNWPKDYPKEEQCIFQILPPKNHKILMFFLFFEMESNPLCDKLQDRVLVKVANSTNATIDDATEKVKLCTDGTNKKVWDSKIHYPKVFVDAKADDDVNVGRGYLIGYIMYTDKKESTNGGNGNGGKGNGGIVKHAQPHLVIGLLLGLFTRYFMF